MNGQNVLGHVNEILTILQFSSIEKEFHSLIIDHLNAIKGEINTLSEERNNNTERRKKEGTNE